MILEIDIGNTRAKWRLLGEGNVVAARGGGEISEWLRSGLPREWRRNLARVRAASVVATELELKLADKIRDSLGLEAEFARSSAQKAGLINAYSDPQSLGVDRWLALLAAYKQVNSAVLVVDVGSALTIDLADRQGAHRGGYIIPGPRLMQEALLRDTDRVRFEARESLSHLAFGSDTADCVAGGIVAAQVGAVLVAMQIARAAVGDEVRLFVTGGWGAEVGGRLQDVGAADFVVVPELVLDGLRWALP